MKFENEFTVAAPLEATWELLQDLPKVAQCLPGAMLSPSAEDGIHAGRIRIKAGPIRVAYEGTVRPLDVDAAEHRLSFEATGREDAGSGAVRAVIQAGLAVAGDGTRIALDTDLQVTGRAAQFGRGVMEDISTRLLDEFARRLERLLVDGAEGRDGSDAAPAGASVGQPEADELDMGFAFGAIVRDRLPWIGAAAATLIALLLLLLRSGGRRRGLSIRIDYRI